MSRNTTFALISTLILFILLSGCLNIKKYGTEDQSQPNNYAPIALISAPEKAYFGDTTTFDASQSYDKDGSIEYYSWNFGDDTTSTGATSTHIYELENDFDLDYPIIYPVILVISDDDNYYEYAVHEIKLYPKGYIFYLASGEIKTEKPSFSNNMVQSSFGYINHVNELNYELSDSVYIKPCSVNVNIYLEKTLLSTTNRISMVLYDENGEEVKELNSRFDFGLGKEKNILLDGNIDFPFYFKSVKLFIYGFSLGEKISILYGGEKASQICFDFL